MLGAARRGFLAGVATQPKSVCVDSIAAPHYGVPLGLLQVLSPPDDRVAHPLQRSLEAHPRLDLRKVPPRVALRHPHLLREAFGRDLVVHDMEVVRRGCARDNGDVAVVLLDEEVAPVHPEDVKQQPGLLQDDQVLDHVLLEPQLQEVQQKAATEVSPGPTDWPSCRPCRIEEEGDDVRIYLRDDGETDIEQGLHGTDRNVRLERTIPHLNLL
mmetsp:Transcript_76334/g.223830  ORF Transcript_76334/g.223830 Transcript_76334/m.223830 type:complete len:213 (+) Transcript_76334:122-760(+)